MDPIQLLQSMMSVQGNTADQTNPVFKSQQEPMKYNGITSSSEEDKTKKKSAENLSTSNLANLSVDETNKNLIDHIQWQESELKRLKTLILLTCVQ